MSKEWMKKLKYPVVVFVILSISTHLIFFLSLHVASLLKESNAPKTVEIEFIEPNPTLKKKNQQQIVQQEKQINDEVDKNAKYLSKFNQRVKRQTRAANSGEFKNTAKPGEQVAGSPSAPKKPQQQRSQKTPAKQKTASKKNSNTGPGKIKNLSQLIPKYSVTPNARKDLARHVGDPSQTDDYLKNVETGLQTALSTREFLYYSYYDRIKKKIRQFWEPNVRQQVKMIYRKGRTIASSSDRITQVLITLDASGSLERIEVITQSGVSALDNAAIEAFKEAAPFPNPPKGMVEQDGRIRIRWDFILEANLFKIKRDTNYASLASDEKSF